MTGPPASGKTTLAQAIAAALRLPLYTKDAFKELLYDTLGTGDLEWSTKLGAAAMEILSLVVATEVDSGHSLVVEANFRRATPAFVRAKVVQVFCTDTADALNERYRARNRHPGHLDAQRVIDPADYAPLELGGRRFVYSVGHDVDALIERVRACV